MHGHNLEIACRATYRVLLFIYSTLTFTACLVSLLNKECLMQCCSEMSAASRGWTQSLCVNAAKTYYKAFQANRPCVCIIKIQSFV